MSRFGPPQRPRRPAWWPIALSLGTTVSAAVAGVASNLLSEYAGNLLGPASVILAVGGFVASVWLGIRRLNGSGPEQDSESGDHPPEPVGPGLPGISGFTGREADVSRIITGLREHQAVAVIGRRGVGTSYSAVQAALRCRDSFPDGQFYLDLRDEGRPKPAATVLAELARKLGGEPPRSTDREALRKAADALHTRLADGRRLLILDNVDDLTQIQPLLPLPAGAGRLLLAGTRALTRVAGVVPIHLGEPTEQDAVRLFIAAAQAGGAQLRVDSQTEREIHEIVQLCGRQPRAVRQLGRWIAQYGWHSADLVKALHRAAGTAAHRQIPDLYMIESLNRWDTAYLNLSRGARRIYRLMALVPGPLDRTMIDVLAHRSRARTDRLVHELTDAQFLEGGLPENRYRIRPLLACGARLHLHADEPRRRRVAAQTRIVRHLAQEAERHRINLATSTETADRSPALLLDDDPRSWFALHQDICHALVEDLATATNPLPDGLLRWWFRLAAALCAWYDRTGRLDRWAQLCQAVLDSGSATDHPEITGWAHNEIGVLLRRRGDARAAAATLSQAIAERRGSAQAELNLALTWLDLDRLDDALQHLERSRLHRVPGDQFGRALTDLASGVALLGRDDPYRARDHLIRTADRFRSLGDTRGYVAALTNLVLVYARLGEATEAAFVGQVAVRASAALPDPAVRAAALLNAGAALLAANPSAAGEAYRMLARSRWLRLHPAGGGPDRGQVPSGSGNAGLGRTLLYLGDAAAALGHPDRAVRHWTAADEICGVAGDKAGRLAARQRGSDGPAGPAASPRRS